MTPRKDGNDECEETQFRGEWSMNVATFRAHVADPKLPKFCREIDKHCPLDRFISYAVKVLLDAGIETFESCEGGRGHSFPEPTIRFRGNHAKGFAALSIAMDYGLPVASVRRYWSINDGQPVGPEWEMTFVKARLIRLQRRAEQGGLIE